MVSTFYFFNIDEVNIHILLSNVLTIICGLFSFLFNVYIIHFDKFRL